MKRLFRDIFSLFFLSVAFFPVQIFAATPASTAATNAILPIVKKIDKYILNPIIIFMFFVATLYFFWGVFVMVSNVDDVKARTDGRQAMLWGVIGMVIMISVFGIINLILSTFNLSKPAILP